MTRENANPQRVLLSPKEVAAITGHSFKRVQALLLAGELPGKKIAGRWKVHRDVLDEFLRGESR